MLVVSTILGQTTTSGALLSVRVIFALACVIVSSSLALAVCVGLLRRIQTIAPPPAPPQPSEPEDAMRPADRER